MLLIFASVLTCLMIFVMITDLTRFIIPNWLVGLLLVLYPVLLLITPHRPDWMVAILIGLGTFAVGFGLFAIKAMGGGDVKLLAVTGLYASKEAYPEFIMGVGILGGLLAILLLILRPLCAYACAKSGRPASAIPRVLIIGEPVPYGIAIAASFLLVLWAGKIPGLLL
jgi:prepilin peptidase CpaA